MGLAIRVSFGFGCSNPTANFADQPANELPGKSSAILGQGGSQFTRLVPTWFVAEDEDSVSA